MAYVNMFTSKGEEVFVDCLDTNLATWGDCGTGVGEAAKGDTTITPWGGARVSATQSQPAADTWQHVMTISFNNTFAITEFGLFDASTTGNLIARSNFAAINVVNGDSIEFTASIQLS